jgi:hypothetical protein
MLHVSPTDKNYRNADFLLQKSYRKGFTEENQSCTEQLILNLAIPASDRLAIFSSMDRDYEAAGVLPRYKYNNTTDIPTNVSTLPKTAILSKARMADLIFNSIQQPVNQFIIIEPYEVKKGNTNYRLRDDHNMRTGFSKLTGKHLVYATFRLYHELASLSVHEHNPQHNDWSYNTCSDFNLGDNVSMITRLRHHRSQGPQLRYFATCLTNCHNSDPNQFHAAHPNWAFGNAKITQRLSCPCKSEKCAALWAPTAKPSRRKDPPVRTDIFPAKSKKPKYIKCTLNWIDINFNYLFNLLLI